MSQLFEPPLPTPTPVPANDNTTQRIVPQEQMPLAFLISLHGNRKKKKEKDHFTRAESSASEMGCTSCGHVCSAGGMIRALCPCTTLQRGHLGQRPRPSRATGFCHVTGCPREEFALPVSVLNIAEHTGHLHAPAVFLPHGHTDTHPGATPYSAFA